MYKNVRQRSKNVPKMLQKCSQNGAHFVLLFVPLSPFFSKWLQHGLASDAQRSEAALCKCLQFLADAFQLIGEVLRSTAKKHSQGRGLLYAHKSFCWILLGMFHESCQRHVRRGLLLVDLFWIIACKCLDIVIFFSALPVPC